MKKKNYRFYLNQILISQLRFEPSVGGIRSLVGPDDGTYRANEPTGRERERFLAFVCRGDCKAEAHCLGATPKLGTGLTFHSPVNCTGSRCACTVYTAIYMCTRTVRDIHICDALRPFRNLGLANRRRARSPQRSGCKSNETMEPTWRTQCPARNSIRTVRFHSTISIDCPTIPHRTPNSDIKNSTDSSLDEKFGR